MRTVGLQLVVLVFLLGSAVADAQEMILVRGKQFHAAEEKEWEQTARFFGLNLQIVGPHSTSLEGLQGIAERQRVVAILISGDALLDARERLERLTKQGARRVPLLIYDVRADTDGRELNRWSHGLLTSCEAITAAKPTRLLYFDHNASMAGALAGKDLATASSPTCRLISRNSPRVEPIITESSAHDSYPVLMRVRQGAEEVFVAPEMQTGDRSWMGRPDSLELAFSYMASKLLFVTHAAGPYAWHLDGRYANLTVDDPWLAEPYGNLSYRALLAQMEVHRFHTTIAFVPWNYDRSQAEAAAIVRQHPDLFSLCLHGNNHLHREFGPYSEDPLDAQIRNVRQGIARMEELRRLTGIPYDRFMVFPHGVAPEPTFAVLRRYGFLGTANSLNVPSGEPFPQDPLYMLRPYTTNYSGLLSLSRLSIEAPIPRGDLAILTFLGEPILLYGHEQVFADGGRHALDVVDAVNTLSPRAEWASLGTIVRHLYHIRQTAAARYSVRMLSREASIRNPSDQNATFDITLRGAPAESISEVQYDGRAHTYFVQDHTATMSLMIAPGQEHTIRVHYGNKAEVTNEPIQRREVGVFLIRYVSDFRDRWLSVHNFGRELIGSYYKHSGEAVERRLEHLLPLVLAGGTVLILIAWLISSHGRGIRRRVARPIARALSWH